MLTADLPSEPEEFSEYLNVLKTIEPWVQADACSLLRLEANGIRPLVSTGMINEAYGRSFLLPEQPWLKAVLLSEAPIRYLADEHSRHPHDGLLTCQQLVQDSYAVRLMVHNQCWGVLVMDAADPQRFSQLNAETLQAVCSMVEARVQSMQTLEQLKMISDSNLPSSVIPCDQGSALRGNSMEIRQLRHQITSAATSHMTVMICGEAGTGKRLVARELHRLSGRSGSMQLVDCQALPAEALESELFGHAAPLGCTNNDHLGKIKLACQGTLVISSFELLPLSAQKRLTCWLQKNNQKISSANNQPARILVTSSADLVKEVDKGNLQKELLQRLSAYSISVPNLQQRGEDIELLAGFYLEQQKQYFQLRVLRLADDAIQAIYRHNWPGNIPELAQRIYRAVRKHPPDIQGQMLIDADALGLNQDESDGPSRLMVSEKGDLKVLVDDYQRQLIRHHLQLSDGNWAQVARGLQVDRSNLYRLAKRLGLK